MFSLPVPISLRSPPSQLSSIRPLLRLDSIPYFQCLPPGYHRDLYWSPYSSKQLYHQWTWKHGPLGLNVLSLPHDQVKVLLEVVIKDLPVRVPSPVLNTTSTWVFQVFPSSSPASKSNLTPDQLTAQPLSSPECQSFIAKGQMTLTISIIDLWPRVSSKKQNKEIVCNPNPMCVLAFVSKVHFMLWAGLGP